MSKETTLAWERRWAVPVAAATFLAVVLLVISNFANQVSGTGSAEILRSAHEHSGSVLFTGLLQVVAFSLLIATLYYLFRAVRSRSEKVRQQLVGLVLVAPLFLAASSGLAIGARGDAADQFVAGEAKSTLSAAEAKEECRTERNEEGAKDFADEFEPGAGESAQLACEKRKSADNEADNAVKEASLAPVVTGLGIAGSLGFVIVLFYCGLWAMRTGLLSRFWASFGMVSGVAFLLGPLFVLSLLWFLYFALVVIDRVPGGRPPAWAAGEAIPWPTPGEAAAKELAGTEPPDGEQAQSIPEPDIPQEGETSDPPGETGPPRKRKRRNSGDSGESAGPDDPGQG